MSTAGIRLGIDRSLRLLFARTTAKDREDLRASDFSFHHVRGACTTCAGRGQVRRCDLELLIPDPSLSLDGGALIQNRAGKHLFARDGRNWAVLAGACGHRGIDLTIPWGELPDEARRFIAGGAEDVWRIHWEEARKKGEAVHEFEAPWPGLSWLVEEEFRKKKSSRLGPHLEAVMAKGPCADCRGERLKQESRERKLAGMGIARWRALSVEELGRTLRGENELFQRVTLSLDEGRRRVFHRLSRRMLPPLEALMELGLGYLELDRPLDSLSGGEFQRLNLAGRLFSGLQDMCHVFDEPGLGLHGRDKKALGTALARLAAQGNTVVFVDHDPVLARCADKVIELGPGAGRKGGSLLDGCSLTSPMGERSWPGSGDSRARDLLCHIQGARVHNLKHIDLEVRYGEILTLCGVSGSGKSTLLFDVLAASVTRGSARGCQAFDMPLAPAHLAIVRGRPLGHGPFSTLATLVQALDHLRRLFASLPEARELGLKARDFSFQNRTWRCPRCLGSGWLDLSLDFLPSPGARCPQCQGRGLSGDILKVTWQGLSFSEVLNLEVNRLDTLTDMKPALRRILQILKKVGLGHLALGRRCDSLSGGESQRLAMARALISCPDDGSPLLLVLDEPSRGLHPRDQRSLATLLHELAQANCAVVMTEHAPEMLEASHRLVELGPEGGPGGGRIIFSGTPHELRGAKTPTGDLFRSL